MADSFPPSEPLVAVSAREEEEEKDVMEDDIQEMEEDFTVQLGATYSCRKPDGTYHKAEVVKMRTNKRAQREEYMVRYLGTTRRQTEWIDKSRIMEVDPQEDEEEPDLEVDENDETLEYVKPDEDEPKIKKAKVEGNGDISRSSLISGDLAEELTCLLCSKIYEDPVMVECGHNFCRRCIDETWEDEETFTCPDCNEELTEKSFTTNRTLAKLLQKTLENSVPGTVINCPEHEEKVKIFCKDDETLCCIICRDSLKHANHTFLPIVEAAAIYREKLSGLIDPLGKALVEADKKVIKYKEQLEQYKPTVAEDRQRIVSDFEKLNGFLKQQKEKLLLKFNEQSQHLQQEMRSNAVRLEETLHFLREAVTEAGERASDQNSISFLTGVQQFLQKIKNQKSSLKASEKAVTEKELCRGTFNGPIQYMVWKEMKSIISPIPEDKESKPSKVKPAASVPKAIDKKPEAEESDDDEEATQVPDSGEIEDVDLTASLPHWFYKGRRDFWIIGDGCVSSCGGKNPYGYNLGFPHPHCNVRWFPSIKWWAALLPKLKKEFSFHKKPSLIFIHEGSFDLARKSSKAVIKALESHLAELFQEFPKVHFVLSVILPRKEWLGTFREGLRKGYNATLCQQAAKYRFIVAQHEDLEAALLQRYKAQGGDSLLTQSESNMFVKNMRDAMLKSLLKGSKSGPEKPLDQQKPAIAGPAKVPDNGKNSVTKPINIWMLGNSYVSRLQRHVEKQPYGENLGIKESTCRVHWLSRTTRWSNIIPDMKKVMATLGTPNIVFLHVGTEDLETSGYDVLVTEMRNTLGRLAQLFPKVIFLPSPILPVIDWMGGPLEECRMMFNTRLSNYADKHGLRPVRLYNLEMKMAGRFGGVHNDAFLSASENEMFAMMIKESLLGSMVYLNNRNKKEQAKSMVPS